MNANVIPRPETDEYPTSFAGYISRIAAEEDIVAVLGRQLDQVLTRLERIPEARGDYRYEAGKWSIKEVVGHLADTERVFAYRALRIARGDATPLPSFDDQSYVLEMRLGQRRLVDVAAEWADVRRATLSLFRHLPAPAWSRLGIAGGHPISVRALAYVIAGHSSHHLEVLSARYGA